MSGKILGSNVFAIGLGDVGDIKNLKMKAYGVDAEKSCASILGGCVRHECTVMLSLRRKGKCFTLKRGLDIVNVVPCGCDPGGWKETF